MTDVTVFVLDGLGYRFSRVEDEDGATLAMCRAAALVLHDGEPVAQLSAGVPGPRDLKASTNYARFAVALKRRLDARLKGAA